MLPAGTRLGAYEILSSLGAGGMGEVYRARDTKLDRDVALKILPESFASDPDRLMRFEREAKTLASLNHPHIAQIHSVQEGADATGTSEAVPPFLVMELVEGEDLAQRISRLRASGAAARQAGIPLDEALPIARQIAEALETAHEAGIIHRDLKPANIKVRPDGTVKVLDFGLAKQAVSMSGSSAGLDSPTITSPARLRQGYGEAGTEVGVILGTAAYMSPEQARGKAVDKRADIWAFGCVLYEMLTAVPAFEGETVTDVLSAVVRGEPNWSALPADTPREVQRLLRRCLQKDAAKRLRDSGDLRVEIEEILTAPATERAETPGTATRRLTRARLAIAWLSTLVIVGAAAAAITSLLRPAAEARVNKLSIALGGNGLVREPVISPDGTKIVFVAPAKARLSVRALDQWAIRELEGTEGAVRPFWSPDSQWIGYFRNEQLLRVPADGGPVVRVATLPAVQVPLRANSGAWTEDGYITIALGAGGLMRVAARGGELAPFPLQLPPERVLYDVRSLPNGMLLARLAGPDNKDSIVVLEHNTMREVFRGGDIRRPTYSPSGHFIFTNGEFNSMIWAIPFDLATLAARGEPFIVGEGSEATLDRTGTLAFVPVADVPRDLAWFDMSGRPGPRLAEPRPWTEGAAVSRDGKRVLASTAEGIWTYDVASGARSRVTTGSYDITPQWVNANTIVFVRTENLQPVLVLKDLGPSGTERVLARPARFPRVTADGRRLVFNLQDSDTSSSWTIAWIDMDDLSRIHQLPAIHRGARFPSVSPNGTLVAYVSGELGRDEIYLTRFPSGEGKWQISTNGGGWTLFHPTGRSVVYRTPDNAMISVPVSARADVEIGQPQKLFDWGGSWAPFYDFAPDGERGIAALPLDAPTLPPSISVVQNWWREFAQPR